MMKLLSVIVGEGLAILNHQNPFFNFQSAKILRLRGNFSNQCFNTFFSFRFIIFTVLKPCRP